MGVQTFIAKGYALYFRPVCGKIKIITMHKPRNYFKYMYIYIYTCVYNFKEHIRSLETCDLNKNCLTTLWLTIMYLTL